MIRRLFSPPSFESEEETFRARFINGFLWIVIAILLLSLISPSFGLEAIQGVGYTTLVLSSLIGVMLFALFLLRRGYVYGSGMIVVIMGWLGIGFQAFTADGVRDVIIIAYIAISLLASIVLSWRAGGYLMLASIISIWILAILEVTGIFVPRVQNPLDYALDFTLIFIAIASLIYFSTNRLRDAITRATLSEEQFLVSNMNLQELNLTLEERVSNRTMELEIASKINERRARQFEAMAQVAKAISTIQDPETLLPRIAEVISEQFGHYHTGIFLLDNAHEFAVLRATNSPGGRRMLAREHKLQIGRTGIVGYVTATGQPRIALDVGSDAVYFDNPDLPNTRSEIALPLRIAGQVIGAIDVQSEEENAFKQEDLPVLIALADQVSIALQNTRILEDARRALTEAQKAYGESIQQAWKVEKTKSIGIGLQWANATIKPLEQPLKDKFILEVFEQDEPVVSTDKTGNLAIPIRMRDRVIGVMSLKNINQVPWTEDEIDIAKAIGERLSLAIETATLLQSTQHRAEIERITTDITSKISSASRFETILQTTAQELSRALGGSDVLVQIEPIALELGMTE